MDNKEQQINNYLLEEQAKADALYPHKRNDPEQFTEGAFKGGLTSGLALRVHEAATNARAGVKTNLGYILGGALLGGGVQTLINNKKVDNAVQARRLLAGKRVNERYIKKKKNLLKESSADLGLKGIESYKKNKKNKEEEESVLKSTLSGGALGAGIGALTNIKNPLKGVVSLGTTGAASSAASTFVDNEEKDKKTSMPVSMGISFGVGAAAEPLAYRVVGKMFKNKKNKYFSDSDIENITKAEEFYKDKQKDIGKWLLPNMLSKTKHGWHSDDIDVHRGMNGKFFDKDLSKHMAGKMLWGGLLGYGVGKGFETYIKHRQKKQKEKLKQQWVAYQKYLEQQRRMGYGNKKHTEQ